MTHPNDNGYSLAHPGHFSWQRQPTSTVTLDRALRDGTTPGALRAVAARNAKKGTARNMAQAAALRNTADELEEHYVESYREAA